MLHELMVWLGLTSAESPQYLFWSGFAGTGLSWPLLGALLYRRHNCHVRGCWRIGKFSSGDWMVCRKHHPTLPSKGPRAEDL